MNVRKSVLKIAKQKKKVQILKTQQIVLPKKLKFKLQKDMLWIMIPILTKVFASSCRVIFVLFKWVRSVILVKHEFKILTNKFVDEELPDDQNAYWRLLQTAVRQLGGATTFYGVKESSSKRGLSSKTISNCNFNRLYIKKQDNKEAWGCKDLTIVQ